MTRAEDAFDVPAVDAWLRTSVPDLPPGLPAVTQFSGGASNLTYGLDYPGHRWILRRPPAGTKARSAHDMAREYRFCDRVRPVFPPVPAMVALCTDPTVLGTDFYVMERVDGLILRGDPPPGLAWDPVRAADLCTNFVDTLVDLHGVDPDATGLSEFGRGRGYVARQVAGWTRRFEAARTPDSPPFTEVTDWLAARQPADVAYRVIHGDYRFDNLVLDPADWSVRVLLDWELATVGDPLMDLGSAMAYWVQADDDPEFLASRRQPTNLPGMLTRAEVVERYLARTGFEVDDWTFYEVFGLFRLAVIAQQIWYRYHHGQTTNPAFAGFGLFVAYADRRCRRLLAV